MNASETADAETAIGKARIARLEREAIGRSGDAANVLSVQFDRYQSSVLAVAQVIWTSDSRGEMVGVAPREGATFIVTRPLLPKTEVAHVR